MAAASGLSRADAPAAQGGTGEWTVRVAKIAGVARWRSADEGPWRPLSVGMVLRSGDWVGTGPPGSLVELVYEAQGARVLVESEMGLDDAPGGVVRVLQGQAGPGTVLAQKGPGDAGDETADGGA